MVHRCPPTPNHSLETPDFKVTVHTNTILFSWRRSRHKRRQRYNHCCLGDGIQSIFAALQIYHQDDLKKRMSRRTDAWQNGGFRKMDDLPFLTAPNRLPSEMDFLPKTFLHLILAAFKCVPQTSATTFAFSSAWSFFYVTYWSGFASPPILMFVQPFGNLVTVSYSTY